MCIRKVFLLFEGHPNDRIANKVHDNSSHGEPYLKPSTDPQNQTNCGEYFPMIFFGMDILINSVIERALIHSGCVSLGFQALCHSN